MKYRKTKKFDETLLENQDWKNFKLDGATKYAPCFIESPDIVSKDDRITMIVRNEKVFYPGGHGGNCDHFNNFCWSLIGVPKNPWYSLNRIKVLEELEQCKKTFLDAADTWYEEKCKEYMEKYGINPYNAVFESYLICSHYFSPDSFIHEDGRISMYHNIGLKWTEMDDISDEIEWFAKMYPRYKVFVTLCSHHYDSKEPTPLITLMLFNGEVKVVTTRTIDQMRYVLKLSYDKDDVEVWEDYKKPSKFSKALDKLKDFLSDVKDDVMWKLFPTYSYNREAKFRHNAFECKSERYFEDWQVRDIVENFLDIIEEQKEKASK